MAVAFVFLFGVEGALLYVIYRFRARPGDGDAVQVYGNRRLEVWWTVVPALILVVMFGLTVRAMADEESAPPADALPVTVIGHQWWWEFQYPTLNAVTANEVHVPVGRAIKFTLKSADVVHNFWFPILGGKQELVPGQDNPWTFTVDKAGDYDGACSEYCGGPHAWMRLTLVAQSAADFQAWADTQKAGTTSSTPLSAAAFEVFTVNACSQCHAIRGTSAAGAVAPDLTHVGSRETLAGGAIKNDAAGMRRWLANPQAVKPGSLMPNLHLSDEQLNTLTQYLEGLK